MASSPTAKKTKTKNDTPGCMGRFLSFFDFHRHRHRHGRKLQTHKKYRDGTEAPRNSLDVGLETPQCVETKVEDIPYAHEVKIPHQKDLGKNTTVKTLIAEEISKASDSRRRSPNIVARLMGLEVMPEDYMAATHRQAADIYPHNYGICNQPVEKHLHIPTGNHRKQQFPYELSRQRTDPKVQHERTYNSYEENPHWPDMKQTKMQVSAWQTSTPCDKSNQVQADHLKMPMVKKSMRTSQEDNVEAACECNEHESTDGSAEGKKLQGSVEESAHAIEVLHANKDLCINFLQESKLLAADSQDECSVVTKLENPDTYWTGSRMERNNNRKQLQRLKANKFHLDSQEHQGEAMSFRKRCKDKLFSVLTRIMVLKPGTVKCQNSMLSPSSICSPRSQTDSKNIKLHVNGIDPKTSPLESNGAVHDEFSHQEKKRSGFKNRVSTLTANLMSRKRRRTSDTVDSLHHLQNDKYLEIHSEEAMTETRATDMSDSSKETSPKALCNESEDLQELEIDPMTSTCVEEEVSVSMNNFTNSESEMMPPNCESPIIKNANHPAFETLNEENSPLGLQQSLHCYPNVSTPEDEWKICKQINDTNNEEPIQTSDVNLIDDIRREGSERESASFRDSEMPYSEIPDSNQNFEEFDKVEIETSSLPTSSELEMESKHNEPSNATSETVPTDVVVCPTAVGEEIDLALELVKGIPYPKERLDDLLLISNILVSGGLATNDCEYFSKQRSAGEKMLASMYQRIEECYNESTLQKVVDGSEGSEGNSDDHLLFDCINETLLEILKPYCHPGPWIAQNVSNIIYMPFGKKLLEKIWAKVCSSLYPESERKDELNSLLKDDLGNAGWREFQDQHDEIGNAMAQFILDNLVEDLVRDLVGAAAFSQ